MNNQERETQLSAMFDGELPAAECELLSRRLARDELLRSRWSRYALIGAAMRSEPVAPVTRDFAWRVSAALDTGRGAATRTPRAQQATRVWRNMAAGGVVAAGVAGAAVFLLRSNLQMQGEALVAFTPTVARVVRPAIEPTRPDVVVANASELEPASYVVPPSSVGNDLALPASLANYVVAHSEYSSPLTRRNLISALVASDTAESAPADAGSDTQTADAER